MSLSLDSPVTRHLSLLPSPHRYPRGVLRFRILFLVVLFVAVASPAFAGGDNERVDVIELTGIIDDAKVDWLIDAVEASGREAQAIILRIDSPGAVTDRALLLEEMLLTPGDVPIVVWVGDAPAQALGLAARLVEAAPLATAAPGTLIGYSDIVVIGGGTSSGGVFSGDPTIVDADTGGLDQVQASLGQIVVWLDGQELAIDGGTVVLDTADQVADDDGEVRLQQTVNVRFVEPNLWIRFLSAALSPGALFFFLAAGLTIAAFEFYAIGPGVAAATALLPLLMAGYGIAQLPVTWYGIALLLAGLLLMVAEYQAGAFRFWSWVGTALLVVGGRLLVDGGPTLEPSWAAIVITSLAIGLFFSIAMPVVARSRFSTGTFGRDHLIGRHGRAIGPFVDGIGTIDLGGAHWKASSHREAHITDGDDLLVAAVSGLWLEVETPGDEE